MLEIVSLVIESAAKNLSSMFCVFWLCRFSFALRSAAALRFGRSLQRKRKPVQSVSA